ncbi:MAG TPA: NAD(P)H-dependent oxidoreductase [Ramlibacter sp.]|nr:NAD(P)H-dependent oxidoreductase [Ramlibacter sp.]
MALSLLILPGSARKGSYNVALARAAKDLAESQGASARVLDLRELALPIYDADLEVAQGVPAGAAALRDAISDADAVLVVTPEYNGFPTPLFLNALDWLSRLPAQDGKPNGLAVTSGKPAGLLSASPGPLGGLRSMNFLRQYLQMAFAMVVHPRQFALSRANEAFDADGNLKDDRSRQSVEGVVQALLQLAAALRAPAR